MNGMTVGSLFSGIGGLELGFERAGFEVRWQVETDDYCNRVLTKHWPDVRRHGDVREVGDNLEWVDVICGGFPCQDISNAGKRAGITGERSGLWTEFARIIRVVRPRYVVVENVAALLGRGMGTVLGDLADSGYDAEWGCVSAASVGAPHLRNRVFIIATDATGDLRRASGHDQPEAPDGGSASLADAESQRDTDRKERTGRTAAHECGEDVADAESNGLQGHGTAGQQVATTRRTETESQGVRGHDWWSVEPDVGRVAHGVPNRVHRLRGLGNAVVPQVAEFVARWLLRMDKAGHRAEPDDERKGTP